MNEWYRVGWWLVVAVRCCVRFDVAIVSLPRQ